MYAQLPTASCHRKLTRQMKYLFNLAAVILTLNLKLWANRWIICVWLYTYGCINDRLLTFLGFC